MILTLVKRLLKRPATGAALRHAPTIIQGAVKLTELLRQRKAANAGAKTGDGEPPGEATKSHLEARMEAAEHADMEQLRLLKQLAQQNEALDNATQENRQALRYIFVLALLALLGAGLSLLMVINQS